MWNLHWLSARRRSDREPGVTVVIANYNGADLLPATIEAIRRFSPPDTRIIVVDNASTDGSREWLLEQDGVRTLLNRSNLGHARALDRGFLCVTTEYAVALDSDAFPISENWLDVLLGPLHQGMLVSGPDAYRSFAHPSAFATRTRTFIEHRMSFRSRKDPRGTMNGRFDVGEGISADLPGRVGLIPMTDVDEESALGHVYGGVVYHNFYGTRAKNPNDTLEPWVERSSVSSTWERAVERYLRSR